MIQSIMLLLCQTLQIACKMYISTEGTSKVHVCFFQQMAWKYWNQTVLTLWCNQAKERLVGFLMAAFVNIIEKTLNWHKSFLYFWTSYLYLFTPFFFFLFFPPNLNAFCRVKKQFGKCFLEHTFARVINLLWYLEITPLHKIHPTPTYVSD